MVLHPKGFNCWSGNTVLAVDEMAAQDGVSWVYKGLKSLRDPTVSDFATANTKCASVIFVLKCWRESPALGCVESSPTQGLPLMEATGWKAAKKSFVGHGSSSFRLNIGPPCSNENPLL